MTRLIAIALVLLAATGMASAQGFKVGYVESDKIVSQMPEAIEGNKRIEDQVGKYRDTMTMMQKDFETKVQAYQKQQSLMSAETKTSTEETLNRQRMMILQYQEEKMGQTGEIVRLRKTLMQPIEEKVREAINQVSKEEKLNLVLDKASGIVLYSDDKADITYKVLDKLKRGGK